MAYSPPAVFSISTRNRETALVRLANEELAPVRHAVRGVVIRSDVPTVHHEPDGPDLGRAAACCVTNLREGMRIRLFGEARLTT